MARDPRVQPIRGGWAAVGAGWAVFASSPDEAVEKYERAERIHREIMARPDLPSGEEIDAQAIEGRRALENERGSGL